MSILKIDVEGYEPAVIAGATKTLERTGEYSPDLSSAGGLAGHDMLDRLFNAGFQPFALDEQGSAVPVFAGELRSSNGQMDLVMIKTAAR